MTAGQRVASWAAWYRQRDRNLSALRRAGRAAILLPALFLFGLHVVGDSTFAMFAAFGAFAMVLLADIEGDRRRRAEGQVALAAAGVVLVCLGTLASVTPVVAAASMTVVAFVVLFTSVVSSSLAGVVPSLLLSFILPVSLVAPASDIPARAAGWALAGAAAVLAIAYLWPVPREEPLRLRVVETSRALAAAVEASIAADQPGSGPDALQARTQALDVAGDHVEALHHEFVSTPYRPASLSAEGRGLVGVVDHLIWFHAVLVNLCRTEPLVRPLPEFVDLERVVSDVLERCAQALSRDGDDDRAGVAEQLRRLEDVRAVFDAALADHLHGVTLDAGAASGSRDAQLARALDRSFRVQELAYGAEQMGTRVVAMVESERRTWFQRLVGEQPGTTATEFARRRLTTHLHWRSVWLHNAIRGAVALGLATLVATESGVQHAFWVVLGTMSVLRSNALSTGQNAVRALVGTAVGFVVGSVLVLVIGPDEMVLSLLLPVAVLLAGVAPAAVSYAAGQAAFTTLVVILFNLISPVGWSVGIVRVEDVALGCLVSLAVGLLFWPRGARTALHVALADAYCSTADYLGAATEYAVERCSPRTGADVPLEETARASHASAVRLDDAFRTFLTERGAKPLPLADVVALVTGAVKLRLAADSIVALWDAEGSLSSLTAEAVRGVLVPAAARHESWFDEFARTLRDGTGPPGSDRGETVVPALLPVVREALVSADPGGPWSGLRVAWTADLLDAVGRMRTGLVCSAAPAPEIQDVVPGSG